MSNPITRADYDQLSQIAKRFAAQAQAQASTLATLTQSMQTLQTGDWVGQGATAFYNEMNEQVLPSLRRLVAALQTAQRTTRTISTEVKNTEDEAAHILRHNDNGSPTPTHSPVSPVATPTSPETAPTPSTPTSPTSNGKTATEWFKAIAEGIDTAWDWMSVPALGVLLSGLRLGTNYPGQIIFRVPQFIKDLGIPARSVRDLIGLSGHLNHINAANLPHHIARGVLKISKIDVAITALQSIAGISDTWAKNSGEYSQYDPSKRVSAMAFDAAVSVLPPLGELAGSVGGRAGGAWAVGKLGAAIGTLIAPGPGTVIGAGVGALVGGVGGGLLGDYLGGQAGDALKSWASDPATRTAAINWIDNTVAQPVANLVSAGTQKLSDASNAVRNAWDNATKLLPDMPSFSWP
jgi:WXG100 family type VII secretion target